MDGTELLVKNCYFELSATWYYFPKQSPLKGPGLNWLRGIWVVKDLQNWGFGQRDARNSWFTFKHLESDYCFVVFICYLPPELSPWEGMHQVFFAHLLSQNYLCSHTDAVYSGDFNSRVGNLDDYLKEIDKVKSCTRWVCEQTGWFFNLIIFRDSKMCLIIIIIIIIIK